MQFKSPSIIVAFCVKRMHCYIVADSELAPPVVCVVTPEIEEIGQCLFTETRPFILDDLYVLELNAAIVSFRKPIKLKVPGVPPPPHPTPPTHPPHTHTFLPLPSAHCRPSKKTVLAMLDLPA
jgi:hypothetical protein